MSFSSKSLVINFAAFASVLAKIIRGTPMISAASLADFKFLTIVWVGTKTLPPIWPHFFSEASWSSKWAPAAPAFINFFVSSNTFSGPPNPASPSAMIGIWKSILSFSLILPSIISICWIWSALINALFIASTNFGALS